MTLPSILPGAVVKLKSRSSNAYGSGKGIISRNSRGVVINVKKFSKITVSFPEQIWHGAIDELDCITPVLIEGTLVQKNPQKGYTFHSSTEMSFVAPSSVGVVVSLTQRSCRVDFQECHCIKCSFGDVLPMYRMFRLGELVRFNTLYSDYKPLDSPNPLNITQNVVNTLRPGLITAIHTDGTISVNFLSQTSQSIVKRLSYEYLAPVMCLQSYGFTSVSIPSTPQSSQLNLTSSITLKYTLGMKVERRKESNIRVGEYNLNGTAISGNGNSGNHGPSITSLSPFSQGVVSAIRRDGSVMVSCASGSAFVARPHELKPSTTLSTIEVGQKVISNQYLPFTLLSLERIPEHSIGTVTRIGSNGVITVTYGKDKIWLGIQQELLPASYAISNDVSEPCPFEPGDKISLVHSVASSPKRSCGVPEGSVGVVCDIVTKCEGDHVTKLVIVSFKESSRWVGLPSEIKHAKDDMVPGCKVRRNIWRRSFGNEKVSGKLQPPSTSALHVAMLGVGTVIRVDRDNKDIVYVRWCDGEYACSEKDLMLI